MLQFIVQFLPLIFLCAAFGVVLLNFDSVAAYIVYVISMLTQPKELLHASSELAAIPLPPQAENKKKFSLFRPFIRIYTLIIVLFFPQLDIEKITGKKSKKIKDVQVNVYEEKTQEEISKYRIKSYSVPSDNNMSSFRNAFEPSAPLSSTFKQAFPDVVNILDKINKIDVPLINTMKPQVAPLEENNIMQTLPEFRVYDGQASQKAEPPTPVQPAQSTSSESTPEKFDAIAALEKKVSELKKDKVTSVSQVNYNELTQRANEVNSGKVINVDIPKANPLPPIAVSTHATEPEEAHVFGGNLSSNVNLNFLPFIGKIVVYTILSLPLLIVVGSIMYYLVSVRFDLSQISGYPGWVSKSLEDFVKMYIIRNQ